MTLSTTFTLSMVQRTEMVGSFSFMLTIRKSQYLKIQVLVSVV